MSDVTRLEEDVTPMNAGIMINCPGYSKLLDTRVNKGLSQTRAGMETSPLYLDLIGFR